MCYCCGCGVYVGRAPASGRDAAILSCLAEHLHHLRCEAAGNQGAREDGEVQRLRDEVAWLEGEVSTADAERNQMGRLVDKLLREK